MWCNPCRAVGMIHCAHPDECGNMLSDKAAADNWKAWLDDLPLDAGFAEGIGQVQDFISGTVALATAQAAQIAEKERTYDDLYADALADAKSDAQDFDSDLWIEVRKFLTELHLDWRDYADDGITAEQAIEYIRECMDEETHRAEAAEAKVANLVAQIARLEAKVAEVTSDRAFIIGANAGWEAAVEQDEATPAAAAMLARAEAAEAEAATLRAEVERLRGSLTVIDAMDPEGQINGFSESALRGTVLHMGAVARAALEDGKC